MNANDPIVRLESGGRVCRVAIPPLSVCRIGRDATNDVVLGSAVASRSHAMIRRDLSGRCTLSDAGSRNGTLLNGLPVSAPVLLNDGDVVVIGGDRLVFEQAAVVAPLIEQTTPDVETQVFLSTTFVTVFVADIRGFTKLAREMGETTVSKLLSGFFAEAGTVLTQRRCWYQKYLGDCIMGLWVHDQPAVDRLTLATVLDATLAIQELTAPLQSRYGLREPLRFGVGINSGFASIGNLGSAASADFTAVGDTVNRAFRLETATRDAGVDMLIGHETIERLEPPIALPDAMRRVTVELKDYDVPEPAFGLALTDLSALAAALIAPPSAARSRKAVAS